MSTLLFFVASFISAVSPSAMLNNQSYVNIAYASPKSTLVNSVLAVQKIPETTETEPALIIVYTEFEGEKVANHEEGGKSSPSEATERRNEEILAIKGLIKQYFPKESLMVKIVECEGGFFPTAKNKESSAKGLLQILDGTWKHFECSGDVLNAEDNLACGVKILKGQGLSAWSESFSCWKNTSR